MIKIFCDNPFSRYNKLYFSWPWPNLYVDLDLMILEPVLNNAGVLQKLLPNGENIKNTSFYYKPDISERNFPF